MIKSNIGSDDGFDEVIIRTNDGLVYRYINVSSLACNESINIQMVYSLKDSHCIDNGEQC